MTDFGTGLAVPAWVALIVILLAIIFSWWSYRETHPVISRNRRYLLTSLRSLALFILLLTLFDTWIAASTIEVHSPELVIALDRSSSMARTDKGETRFERGRDAVSHLVDRIGSDRTRLVLFSDTVIDVTPESLTKFDPTGSRTDIQGLIASLTDRPTGTLPGGLILISDGLPTASSGRSGSASPPFPVHTLAPGPSPSLPDVRITEIHSPRLGFPGVRQTVSIRLEATVREELDVSVTLTDGRGYAESRSIRLRSGDGEYNASFLYRPDAPGNVRLRATVGSINGEPNRKNNIFSTMIDVEDEQRSVLLIAGAPSPDVAFIRRIIERMPDVDLSVRIGLGTRPVSLSLEDLRGRDLLVLIDYPTAATPEETVNIIAAETRRAGTSLLIVPGPRTSPELMDRLSVPFSGSIDWSRTAESIARPVPGGVRHALTGEVRDALEETDWNDLPPLSIPVDAPDVSPSAAVLLQAGSGNRSRPLLATIDRGTGRTAMFAGYDLWRWELAGEGLAEARGAEPFPLLRSLISTSVRWLESGRVPGNLVIYPTRQTWRLGESVVFRGEYRSRAELPENEVEFSGFVRRERERFGIEFRPVAPGLVEGRVAGLDAGEWMYSGAATAGGKSLGRDGGTFTIDSSELEDRVRGIDRRYLRGLSSRTGGLSGELAEADVLVDSILSHPASGPKAEGVRSETLLRNSAWFLCAALLLFSIEWYLRRRWGLL